MSVPVLSLPKVIVLSLGSLLLLTTGCVEFKTMTLYSGTETVVAPAKPEKIGLLVEPIILKNDLTDVWGLEKTVCKDASLSSDVTYQGDAALLLTWDRAVPDCEWAGIGIGWDSYAGKDISELINYAAIEMHVRTQEGKMFGLPIVLTLEDYSGGMGFAYTGNKYFERSAIDEKWQKVVVPLSAFDMKIENLDPTNIKQLMFELQQSGSIYLADVQLVFYEPEPQTAWLVEAPRPDPLAMPKQLFSDGFINNNGWGLITDACQNFDLSTAEHAEGNQSIHARWSDPAGTCKNMAIGVSWNKWFPVDITEITDRTALKFKIKTAAGTFSQLPIKVAFEDYDRTNSEPATLLSKYVAGGQYNTQWQEVTIPMSAFSGGVDKANVKQLMFKFEQSGDVFIDDVRLVDR
jgi:hypothetical protein